MKKKIAFIGLDVDTKNYHGHILLPGSDEGLNFRVAPTSGALIKKLKALKKKNVEIKLCYEAGYLGFTLYYDLIENGFHCDIIAPSNIPRAPGDKLKNDRVDARKLAYFYKKDMLSFIHVPTPKTEADRDLIRARGFLQKQMVALKMYMAGFSRKTGLNYKERTNAKQYWTADHLKWIKSKAATLENPSHKTTLVLLLEHFSRLKDMIEDFNIELDKLSKSEHYAEKVAALSCFRGISRVFSLQLITEIGDVNRFEHPKNLVSYAGMDVVERSSGGREKRLGITKTGNRFIRTAVIEACQLSVNKTPRATKHLTKRRNDVGSSKEQIAIADKCMRRLYKKSNQMIFRGKHTNKVKTACGRELLGFVWAALKAVS